MDKFRITLRGDEEKKKDLIARNKIVAFNPDLKITKHLEREKYMFEA